MANSLKWPRVYCADADGEFDYTTAQQYAKAHRQEVILTSALAKALPADTVGRRIDIRTAAIKVRQAPATSLLAQLQRINTEAVDRSNMNS